MGRVLFQAEGSACAKSLRQERERESLSLVGAGKEDQSGFRVEPGWRQQVAGDKTTWVGTGQAGDSHGWDLGQSHEV